ncbi:MAG: cell division protein FtsZ, partial [Clostridia bacterium]|nr:cell division protein FtsZ [Clostridia bacterium]
MNKISNKQNLIDIKVIGIGGGGNNAVTRMIEDKIKDVEFVLINTELNALKKANPKQVLQIGKESTKGLGAGANAEVGEIAAKESVEEIENIIEGTDMLFLTCGMGGGTGTGATPIIAELARRKDILTIGVVTKPFTF